MTLDAPLDGFVRYLRRERRGDGSCESGQDSWHGLDEVGGTGTAGIYEENVKSQFFQKSPLTFTDHVATIVLALGNKEC